MPETDLNIPLEKTPEGVLWLLTHHTILELGLSGVAEVERRKKFWDLELPTPNIVVCPAPELINPSDGTNEQDDIQYAFMASILAASNRDHTEATAGWLFFCRREIRKAFMHKPALTGPTALPTDCAIIDVVVEPGDKYINEAVRMNYDAAYQVIRYTVRENRNA
jgi:hypothetical protein